MYKMEKKIISATKNTYLIPDLVGDVILYFRENKWHSSSRPPANMWCLPSLTIAPFIGACKPTSCLQILLAMKPFSVCLTSYIS